MLGVGIYKAFALIAAHVREHPEAGKAIYEHVFMPLLSGKGPADQDKPNSGSTAP